MYKGEELIDVDKLDLTNQEVATAVKASITKFFDVSKKGIEDREQRLKDGVGKLENAFTRSDVERVEKKKSILSNILFIIGSAFSPELTPTELYGKQHMSQGRKEQMEKVHSDIADKIKDVNDRIDRVQKFLVAFDNIKIDVLSSDEKIKNFLRAEVKAYKENEFSVELVDTGFLHRTLINAGYVKESEVKQLIASGVNLLRENTLQNSFLQFNDWYVKTIGNAMQK